MTKRRPALSRAANDNLPRVQRPQQRVVEVWPRDMPVATWELDLLERYLSDIILAEADNDN